MVLPTAIFFDYAPDALLETADHSNRTHSHFGNKPQQKRHAERIAKHSFPHALSSINDSDKPVSFSTPEIRRRSLDGKFSKASQTSQTIIFRMKP